MTKYDIRLRKEKFVKGRIERHKNFNSLIKRRRKGVGRLLYTLMAIVMLIVVLYAIGMVILKVNDSSTKEKPKTEIQGAPLHK